MRRTTEEDDDDDDKARSKLGHSGRQLKFGVECDSQTRCRGDKHPPRRQPSACSGDKHPPGKQSRLSLDKLGHSDLLLKFGVDCDPQREVDEAASKKLAKLQILLRFGKQQRKHVFDNVALQVDGGVAKASAELSNVEFPSQP